MLEVYERDRTANRIVSLVMRTMSRTRTLSLGSKLATWRSVVVALVELIELMLLSSQKLLRCCYPDGLILSKNKFSCDMRIISNTVCAVVHGMSVFHINLGVMEIPGFDYESRGGSCTSEKVYFIIWKINSITILDSKTPGQPHYYKRFIFFLSFRLFPIWFSFFWG